MAAHVSATGCNRAAACVAYLNSISLHKPSQHFGPPVCRILEAGLPADTLDAPGNYSLKNWVNWGYNHYRLDELLAPIITAHRARLEAEEQARLRVERRKLMDDRWGGGEGGGLRVVHSMQPPSQQAANCWLAVERPLLPSDVPNFAPPPAAWPPRGCSASGATGATTALSPAARRMACRRCWARRGASTRRGWPRASATASWLSGAPAWLPVQQAETAGSSCSGQPYTLQLPLWLPCSRVHPTARPHSNVLQAGHCRPALLPQHIPHVCGLAEDRQAGSGQAALRRDGAQ